jgi:hypothetical protein
MTNSISIYYPQHRQAKMPAAGATQALRLFCNPLGVNAPRLKTKEKKWRVKKEYRNDQEKTYINNKN